MKITKFKKGKANIYEITIDDNVYKIYDDILLKYELLIDKELDKKKLDKIIQENEQMDSYYKALKYLNIKMRSELELRKYLKKYNASDSSIDYAIKRLKSEGYIDEDRYVTCYINDQISLTHNGPKKIKDDLIKLGLASNKIDGYILNIPYEEWTDRIIKIIDKKAKVNKSSSSLFKSKMYSHLLTLGYPSDMIKTILDDYKLDTSDAFLKEADKMWNKLSLKYDDNELKLYFKNKMFQKGYTIDEINNYVNNK